MSEVRLGRLWAHGRRWRRGALEDLGELVLRLDTERPTVHRLLRRAIRASGDRGVRLRPEESRVAEALADAGALRLEEKVIGTAAEPRWLPWRVVVPSDMATDVAELLGLADPDAERAALLAALAGAAGIPAAIAGERERLAAVPAGAPLRPPAASVLAGCTWSVYAAALRAAAAWSGAMAAGQRPSARELAAQALGWSKAWTPARRAAFEQLLGLPFAEAVATTERFVRLRGPVACVGGGRIIDARAARPWVGLPETAVPRLEVTAVDAIGTLVVENLETFEELCRHSAIQQQWACVFGGGYASAATVHLLAALPSPVAAWGDLDPHGLAIIADLARRLGRAVHPVGMDPVLLDGPHAVPASTEQLADAARLRGQLPEALANRAEAILRAGRVLEQEAIHTAVLPGLADDLVSLVRR